MLFEVRHIKLKKKKLSRQCVGMLTLLSQCLPKLPEHA